MAYNIRLMHPWLTAVADRLSARAGIERAALDLSPAEIDALLGIAGVAAHESGARTNAPLTCYLLGVAHGRSGTHLDELIGSATADAAGEGHPPNE